jgi:hypothetical protein
MEQRSRKLTVVKLAEILTTFYVTPRFFIAIKTTF